VHKAEEEVRVFSRRGNEVTPAVPEVVAAVGALPVRALVLDGEAIALRPDGTPHPFQATMRRFGRKLDVARLRGELPLTPFLFDLLHLDGADLIDRPARERFAALADTAPGPTVPRLVTGADARRRRLLRPRRAGGRRGRAGRCAWRWRRPGCAATARAAGPSRAPGRCRRGRRGRSPR
jgi:DNA ligase-1